MRNSYFLDQLLFSSQRLVEAAEEAHHQHEENPDLQVRFEGKKRKEKKRTEKKRKEKKRKEKKSKAECNNYKMWCVMA